MNISKKSWHYRLIRWWKDKEEPMPGNTCGYLWAIICTFFQMLVSIILISIYLLVLAAPWLPAAEWDHLIISSAVWFVSLGFLGVFLHDKYKHKYCKPITFKD